MLGNGRLSDAKISGQLAHRVGSPPQPFEQPAPGWIGQGGDRV